MNQYHRRIHSTTNLIVTLALLAAGPRSLYADPRHEGPTHDKLKSSGSVAFLTFHRDPIEGEKSDKLLVTWKFEKEVPHGLKYTCTIGLPQGTGESKSLISLYNMGVQARRFDVEVVGKTTGVMIGGQDDRDHRVIHWQDVFEKTVIVPKTGRRQWFFWWVKPNPARPEKVWFIKFEGKECVLEVVAHRVNHFEPDAKKSSQFHMLVNHDVSPPPPEGGGADGDSRN